MKAKLLQYVHPKDINGIHPNAIELWCDAVLTGEIEVVPYNFGGLRSNRGVLKNTRFYIGHAREKIAVFASPVDGDTPGESDYFFDADDGWCALNG